MIYEDAVISPNTAKQGSGTPGARFGMAIRRNMHQPPSYRRSQQEHTVCTGADTAVLTHVGGLLLRRDTLAEPEKSSASNQVMCRPGSRCRMSSPGMSTCKHPADGVEATLIALMKTCISSMASSNALVAPDLVSRVSVGPGADPGSIRWVRSRRGPGNKAARGGYARTTLPAMSRFLPMARKLANFLSSLALLERHHQPPPPPWPLHSSRM